MELQWVMERLVVKDDGVMKVPENAHEGCRNWRKSKSCNVDPGTRTEISQVQA